MSSNKNDHVKNTAEESDSFVSLHRLALPPASSKFLLAEHSSSVEISSFIEEHSADKIPQSTSKNEDSEETFKRISNDAHNKKPRKRKSTLPVKSLIAATAIALTCSTAFAINVLTDENAKIVFTNIFGFDDSEEECDSVTDNDKSIVSEVIETATGIAVETALKEPLTPELINKIPPSLVTDESYFDDETENYSRSNTINIIENKTDSGELVEVVTETTKIVERKDISISDSNEPYAFSLYECIDTPNPADAQIESLNSVLSSLSTYDVSFAFIDVNTKCGYAYNIDKEIYGASSFKGPMGAYVLSRVAESSGISSFDRALIKASIEWSDNDAYQQLVHSYRKTSDFYSWVKELDVKSSLFSRGDFATYSARDALKIWNYINDYLNGKASAGNKLVSTLEEHLSNTNVSFIRDGIEEQLLGEEDAQILVGKDGEQYAISIAQDIVVLNKAGWYEGGGSTYNSTTDNALIRYNGKTYLMCILTSAPATASNQKKVSELAATLWSMRETLMPEKSRTSTTRR